MNAPEVALTQDPTAGAAGSWERQQLGRVGLEKVGLRECREGAMETTPLPGFGVRAPQGGCEAKWPSFTPSLFQLTGDFLVSFLSRVQGT